MRKVIILLSFILLLAGCGDKISTNINKDMAEDTEKLLKITDNAIDDNKIIDDLTEKQMDIILNYVDNYVPKESEMNETEVDLLGETREIIKNMNDYLENKMDYESQKERITDILYE